jgi:hypothetical protein
MSTFWYVASIVGLGGAAYWLARETMVARGQPTSDAGVGVGGDIPLGAGPELRKIIGALVTKLRKSDLGPDDVVLDATPGQRKVSFWYKDPVKESIVRAALLLPEDTVHADGLFYHFEATEYPKSLKTPAWAKDEEE